MPYTLEAAAQAAIDAAYDMALEDAAAARRRVRELVGEVAHQAAKVPQTIEACDHLLSDMEARAEAVEARAALEAKP
jgi:plasmid stabilization system protein ParE